MSSFKITKTRYIKGLQCPRLLWWTVHEPESPELVPDVATQHRFTVGDEIGALARKEFADGVLVENKEDFPSWLAATQRALKGARKIIFEAAFSDEDVFVAADMIRETSDGWILTEVKSSLDPKLPHIDDLSIQMWALQQQGIQVQRAEVMHLNRDFRLSATEPLFQTADLTAQVMERLPQVAKKVTAFKQMLASPLPDQAIGAHCNTPYPCPFRDRCWPQLPKEHIRNLYYLDEENIQTLENDHGISDMTAIANEIKLNITQKRQIAAIKTGVIQVEKNLERDLQKLNYPIAYVDFETIGPAIPLWNKLSPYQACPVQFSCHIEQADGSVTHHEWLIAGAEDPRPEIARALLQATSSATCLVSYNAKFEKKCVDLLAASVPSLSAELLALKDKFIDLLPIVRNNVYHPDFNGSFSIKSVLPALVPQMSYKDLAIGEGHTATVRLEQLAKGALDAAAITAIRRALLEYCKLDTWAMVLLKRKLEELAMHQT